MAHSFEISKKGKDPEDSAFFVGLCGGVLYVAFDHPEANGGMSGRDVKYEINKTDAMKGLDKAIELFDKSGYPDPTRMDDLKEFRKRMSEDKSAQKYIIWYG